MAGNRLSLAQSAAQAFLAELRPQDEAMILAVGSQVEVARRFRPIAPCSATRSPAGRVRHDGSHDAIIRAIDEVQPAKGRRALVLLSDGNDRTARRRAAMRSIARADPTS